MSSPPTPETAADSAFAYKCEWSSYGSCSGEPFFKEHEGKKYCVLHYPGKEKRAAFDIALTRKHLTKDFNFSGVWFPDDIHFGMSRFTTDVNFRSATFNAQSDFRTATFSGETDFRNATFNAKADFGGTIFNSAVLFYGASFNTQADFDWTTFCGRADFNEVTFKDYLRFTGGKGDRGFHKQSSLNLRYARIERPEHVSFHTLTLRPHWFVNVDARKFDFINVDWDSRNVKDEIDSLRSKGVSSPHRMLAIACRHLAVNAEENNRYEEASGFRYMAMDARRVLWVERLRGNFFKAQWRASKKILTLVNRSRKRDGTARRGTRKRLKRFARTYQKSFDLLHWLYWAASGYGEKITRAFVLLIGIWIFFAGLYIVTGHMRVHRAKDVLGAVNYSLSVLTFQKPEPKSVAGLTPLLITFETILGPVQAALLALAIRRKFMR